MNQKRFQKIRSDWRNFPSSLVWANSTAFNWVLREVVVNLIRKQICLHSYLAEANVGKSSRFLAILSPVSLKIHLEENNHKKKHHLLLLWKPQNPFGNETNAAASYEMVTLLWLSLSLARPQVVTTTIQWRRKVGPATEGSLQSRSDTTDWSRQFPQDTCP